MRIIYSGCALIKKRLLVRLYLREKFYALHKKCCGLYRTCYGESFDKQIHSPSKLNVS